MAWYPATEVGGAAVTPGRSRKKNFDMVKTQ
jgi:hypothetical protein